MLKGFAPLLIIGIIAVASLVAAGVTAVLSTMKESPGSGLYGLQRWAEDSPINALRYASGNYTGELLEKRESEAQAVLRSGGKDAALAFAKKEGTLTKGLEYEIASYVPLIDGAVRSMGTVLRLTTPEAAPLGKDFILAPNRTVRFGDGIVLEVRDDTRDIEAMYAYERAGKEAYSGGSDGGYAGITAKKAMENTALYSFQGTAVLLPIDNETKACSGKLGMCAMLDGNGTLRISELAGGYRLHAYLTRNNTVLEHRALTGSDSMGGYLIEMDGKGGGVFSVKVSPEGTGTEFVKVCNYSDYLANGTKCGNDLRALNISLSRNGGPVQGIYFLRLKQGGDNICLTAECIEKGMGKLYENRLIALFSADGVLWREKSASTTELELEAYDVFDWDFRKETGNIVALLPEGAYSFITDLTPCYRLGCLSYQKILEANATQGSASISYGARQVYLGELNFYVNVYGNGRADAAIGDVRKAYGRFANLTGRIPEKVEVFNVYTELDPFRRDVLSFQRSGAAAYFDFADETIEIFPGSGSACHELAHALHYENLRVNMGASFGEGFAESICGIEEGSPGFGECIKYGESSSIGKYHMRGNCIFQALNGRGYITAGFWKRLLGPQCYVLGGNIDTEEGRNLWYYVLSKAAGGPVTGFPHTEEKDYCAG